jgi:hypothetical protein
MDQLCQQHRALRRNELSSTDTKPRRLVLSIDALAYTVSILSLLWSSPQLDFGQKLNALTDSAELGT